MIDGATRIYAIIGDPIRQARSPSVYNPLIRASGRNAVLVPWHAQPDAFAAAMTGLLATSNVDGIVVTFPYKQDVLGFADIVLPRAAEVGAANALRRDRSGRWVADMFDGVGLVRAVEAGGRSVAGSRAWVVGAGGAGSAIAHALAAAGAASINVSDLDTERQRRLGAGLAAAHPGLQVATGPAPLRDVTLLVNATTVGLGDDRRLPIEIDGLTTATTVVDIVPRAGGTPLLEKARAQGCMTIAGSAMVEGQAAAVLEFFWDETDDQ